MGSLPHTDVQAAIRFVKHASSHLPFLPQLPKVSSDEGMIRQVLVGIQDGGWNEKTCAAFKPFMATFRTARRIKFQIAGPYTVAWFCSKNFDEIMKKWLPLCAGIIQNIQEKYEGRIWVQIDEPIWSSQRALPSSYLNLLKIIRSKGPRINIGLHSCATDRPLIPDDIKSQIDFISLDFLQSRLTDSELPFWQRWIGGGKTLVAGILAKHQKAELPFPLVSANPELLMASTSCGLAEWALEDVDRRFGPDQQQRSP